MLRYKFVCLVFTLLLSSCEIQAQQEQGDSCKLTKGGTGKCTILDKCPPVYKELLAGHPPDTLCGFFGYDPIICCPITGSDKTTREPTPPITESSTWETSTELPTTKRPPTIANRNPGDLAREKCAEYAQSVYALVDPPTLTVFRQKVNISLCAIKNKRLIVGGVNADPMEFPHMAAIGYKVGNNEKVWMCGGSLVSDRFVLTAAHCTYSIQGGAARWARVGDLNLFKDNDIARPQDRRIIERIRHPGFKQPAQYHDIALLKLESPVTFDAYTRPACLLASRFEGSAVIATGWGAIEYGEDASNDLMKVTVKTVSEQICNDSFTKDGPEHAVPRGIVGDWQICAGELGKDTCQGDSGGPIAIYDSTYECMYDVVGITSLGKFCGSIVPAVYTRVSHYITWLENTIWKS